MISFLSVRIDSLLFENMIYFLQEILSIVDYVGAWFPLQSVRKSSHFKIGK